MTPRKGQETVDIRIDPASLGRAKLVARNHEQIGPAMRALVESLAAIQNVRDELEKALPNINPCTEEGRSQENFIRDTERALQTVTLAAARVPEEFWTLYLA